jgi:hypothetical protein
MSGAVVLVGMQQARPIMVALSAAAGSSSASPVRPQRGVDVISVPVSVGGR